VGILGTLGLFLPRLFTTLHAWNKIYLVDNAPSERIAIIFGAGLRRDGSPTAILRDRVETGASLYFNGKVEKLLMSGDYQSEYYNEPESMRRYALSLGIPGEAIVLDYAGSRTYDTCFRAGAVFGVENALLVTQKFHLPRALFLCNMLGVKAYGVEANNLNYRRSSLLFWNVREQFATFTAFMDVFLDKPMPVLGQAQPIFLD
jgi:SanA protein